METDSPTENRNIEESANEENPPIETLLPPPNRVTPPPEFEPPPEQNSIPAFPERKTTPVQVSPDPNTERNGPSTASASTDNESEEGSPPPPPPENPFTFRENPFIRLNQVAPDNIMTDTKKNIDDTPPQSKHSTSSDSELNTIPVENMKTKKKRNKCLRCLCGLPEVARWVTDSIQGKMSQFFYHFGRLVARFPLCAITACLILAMLCGVGLIGFTPESRAEKLWVPQDNLAQTHKAYVEATFGKGSRSSYFIVTNTEALADTLTQTFLGYVFDLHDAILAASATVDGTTYTYNTICEKPDNNNCNTNSVLDAFDFTRSIMVGLSDADRRNVVSNNTQTVTGSTFVLDLVAQGRTGSGTTLAATVLKNQYQIVRQEEVVDGETIDERADAWEAEFIDVCKSFDDRNGMKVYINAERSGSDAFREAITGDLSLVGVGYILIIGYAAIMLGRCDCRNFKGTVAISAVISVGLSILSAFGLCSAFGIVYGPVQSVLPFLLLGIGVDDAFVIMSDFSRVDPSLPVPERVGEALRHAGVSITLTSVTDFVAFAIGGFTVLPALRAFCLFAAVGIMFDFLYQVTFFVAFLSLDTRRQKWGRAEGCPCCPAIPIGWALPQSVHDHLKANNGMDYMLDVERSATEKSYKSALSAATGADVEAQAVRVVPNSKSFFGSYRVKPLACCVCCLPCIYPEDFDGSVQQKYERAQVDDLNDRLEAEDQARAKAKGGEGIDEEEEPVFSWSPNAIARMMLEFWFLRALHKPKIGEIPRSTERRAAMTSIRYKVRKAARRNKCNRLVIRTLKTLWFFRPFSGQWFHRVVNNIYAPILLNRYLKPSVLLIGVIIVGVGLYGATTLKQEFSETQFIPDGSYLLDYIDINDKYFSFGPPWQVIFKETDAYGNRSGFDAYRTAMEGLTEWVQADTISFWYTDYKTYLTENSLNIDTVTSTQFYDNLRAFLSANQRYQDDVIMPDDYSVSAHRFGGQYTLLTNSDQYVGAMDDSRSAVDNVVSPLDLDAFAYSFLFISWESFKVIEAELIQNMCLAIVAVFLIALFLVGHPWMACLVTLAVGFTILCMMGFASLWGLSIDSVFVINVVIAIGLSVDYSAHIGHAFQANWGSRNKRAIEAVQGMGEGVLNGAISTFLAVLVLAFSASYVFRVFFVQLFLVVLFGVFHGLVMLPVVLTYIGPQGLPAPTHMDEALEKGSPKPSVKA